SKSMETMQIYAPIAHRLGMQAVKWELEDLSLLYLDPDAYKAIMTTIDNRRPVLEKFMQDMCDKITSRLKEWGIESTINYRLKHVHSIYRKMYTQKLELKEIFDLCALRVIVNDLGECYNVLGQIHDMFKPIPGRFKDYVSTPKPNGYQSIHTTVIGSEGIPFEVQIRTWDMHRAAEYGVAAHWKYKSGESGVKEGDEEKFAWVRRLLENQQSSEASDFFTDLQIDMFADEVFVFSPRGDVINLPANATPIDFAYNIHSAVGNRMVGAKVNGRIVPFDHKLQNGDIVEILTSKASSGPSRDWLNIARSGSARTKIKQWFKKERREENVVRGKEMFDAEMRRNGITLAEVSEADVVAPLLKKLSFATIEDLYAAIGYGGVTATKTVNRIRDDYIRAQKATGAKSALEKLNDAAERRNKHAKPQKAIQGVIVAGIDNCLVKFARCCTPVPGDDIVGFITRGYGVSIHRSDCKNHISGRLNPDSEAGRWIDVSWAEDISESYVTNLQISARDRSGLLMDLATALTSLNAKVRSLNARDLGDGMASANLTVEVKDLAELKAIIGRLSAVRSVTGVTRSNN
ncbi:MAG: bifunctional (p)ppGpp synthetase/guanosine-3',5'-bis(diphosphate) 3'-pyrophosphohydrolase, partial [Oscillospiraceae bacterium]|nr:bifunctional (p)ppGpp synthetase/guanosine-3',5'-bis(diphosphate) 3'-pyrophosphohydrolase [Oscillospiraceae bacterium]